MRIPSPSLALFALTLIAFGIQGLILGQFAPVWQPAPHGLPARAVLVAACALVELACGIGLLWPRAAALAAPGLLFYLLLWLILFRLPAILHAPASQDPWSGAGETLVMVAGAWVLYAAFASDSDRPRLAFATGERGLRIARVLYGLALIPFGAAHFSYLKETAGLVPSWMPGHWIWASFTGAAFIAAGVAVIVDRYARAAAALSALQMGVFLVLVWVPIVGAGARSDFVISETIISWMLVVSAWLVADSYRIPLRFQHDLS